MPDTTVNRGYRIPVSAGTDILQPDDVRVPVTSIDTDMATALANAATALANAATANAAINKLKMLGGTSTTSAGGHLSMPHGYAGTPLDAVVQIWKPTGGPGITWQLTSIDATNVTVQCWDTNGSAVVSTSLRYSLFVRLP